MKAPIVANCASEEEARKLVQAMGDDGDVIEIKGVRPATMRLAFGNVPEGSAVFRFDWIWPADGQDPRPY